MKRDLAAWLRWQEQAHPKAWDLGLERIGAIWQNLGAPRLAERVLIIAGTNGKGSCVRWAEEIAKAEGLRVGSFSSPHLRDYRERIRFQSEWVAESALIQAFEAIDAARAGISLTYFEWSALAAFYLMSQEALALAILEVGLGGRLDACNLIDADAAIITRIGLDHQDWLGTDVASIAQEKAGVFRPGQRIYSSDENPPPILEQRAQELQADFYCYGRDFRIKVQENGFYLSDREALLPHPSFMVGTHQLGQFAAVALALSSFFAIADRSLIQALKHTQNEARLMRKRFAGQEYLLDVAHNEDSAAVLAQHLQSLAAAFPRMAVVCAMLNDKDQHAIFQALNLPGLNWHLADLGEHPRASSLEQMHEQARVAGITRLCGHGSVAEALRAARADLVVVMGSFVTVAAALDYLEQT